MSITKNGRTFKSEQEYILFLENAVAEAQAANNRPVSFKVALVSGAISAYGVNNRRPVTIYATQWQKLIEGATGVKLSETTPLGKIIAANGHLLAMKEDNNEVLAKKLAARKADTSGAVSSPKETDESEETKGAVAGK